LRLWRQQPQLRDQALRQGVGLGVALQVADGVRTADRIGLAQQVVADRHLRIGVGAADLAQRRTGARSHLLG
jgi:hypothetical protein